MKKFICMLTVLLCSVMNLSAQDYNLEGRWVTDLSDEGESTTLIFLFEGNELQRVECRWCRPCRRDHRHTPCPIQTRRQQTHRVL